MFKMHQVSGDIKIINNSFINMQLIGGNIFEF